MLGEKELKKCYKCGFYHDLNYKFLKETTDKDHEGKNKLLCETCRGFDTRSKEDLRIGASFDNRQSIIIKDLAYRIRMLELENQGQQAKIEKLESEKPGNKREK
jgi:hypothetical protein